MALSDEDAWTSVNDAIAVFLDAIMEDRQSPHSQATFDRMSAAIMTMMAYATLRSQGAEARQDAYLEWLVIGVENALKAHGYRSGARTNPLIVS